MTPEIKQSTGIFPMLHLPTETWNWYTLILKIVIHASPNSFSKLEIYVHQFQILNLLVQGASMQSLTESPSCVSVHFAGREFSFVTNDLC